MSRVNDERVIPAKPEQREKYVKEVVCDLCGRRGAQLDTFDHGVEWQGVQPFTKHNEVKVTLTLEESNKYPDGGWGSIYSFDCCPVCFHEKIGEMFKAAGGEMHTKGINY